MGGRTDWLLLDAAQFPGYPAEFDAAVPQSMRGYSPPFFTALPESGLVQVWTGYFARSALGWSLLMRPPANIGPPGDVVTYKGIVESGVWFGPVFANLRLARKDEPVCLCTARPLLQLQPVQRHCYSDTAMHSMSLVPESEDLTSADWSDYATTIVQRSQSPPDTRGQTVSCQLNNATGEHLRTQ